jgi:hypothetical protein
MCCELFSGSTTGGSLLVDTVQCRTFGGLNNRWKRRYLSWTQLCASRDTWQKVGESVSRLAGLKRLAVSKVPEQETVGVRV